MRIVRNCGIFANRIRAKRLVRARNALGHIKSKEKSKLSWRESIIKGFEIEPFSQRLKPQK
jgi:hypothetical protein